MKKVISTQQAPKAIGPYSQAIEANGFLFISGQVPIQPQSGQIIPGGIKEQTRQVLENIAAILNEAGYTFDNVVKSTCFLRDMMDFQEMNEVYAEFYKENQPARSTFAVRELPRGAMVEIETIAAK
jgi:2-iminobutanoate/2-iminopropanoate deaminase